LIGHPDRFVQGLVNYVCQNVSEQYVLAAKNYWRVKKHKNRR
jgi:hypothetical protein